MSEQRRKIVLDTETTGLEPRDGHRVIEIGCVELHGRRPSGNNIQYYLQPDRQIDEGAIAVHGITNEFLVDKPRFANVAEALLTYLSGAELVIHNAAFDVGFLDHEFQLLGQIDGKPVPPLSEICTITDTLKMAREKHPGQKNNLDALCRRYEIDNSNRDFHGALLDAQLLADVYLAMTGGQSGLMLDAADEDDDQANVERLFAVDPAARTPKLVTISAEASAQHAALRQKFSDKLGDELPAWSA